MSAAPLFGDIAAQIHANGYEPIPCEGKVPIGRGWQKHRFDPLDTDFYPNANIGLLCRKNPFFDIDVLDGDDVAALLAHLAERFPELAPALKRTGKAPKCGYLFRTDRPFSKMQQVMVRGEERCKLEFLANGQQFVAFGTHPETGRKYDWNGAGSPLTVRWEDLPVVTEQRAREIFDAAVAFLLTRGWQGGAGAPAADQNDPKGAIFAADGLPPMPHLEGVPAAVLEALGRLDPSPYEQWIRVGLILRAFERDGVEWDAEAAWVMWSERAPNHQPGDDDRWDTFRPDYVASPLYTLQSLAGTLPDPLEGFGPVPPELSLPLFEINGLTKRDLPGQQWVVDHIVPQGVPTLFSAHGGSGKSYTSLQLAVCVAAGLDFFGHKVKKGRVFVYSCEEPEAVLAERLKRILLHYGLTDADLGDRLEIRNGYGLTSNILFTGNKEVNKRLTVRYMEVLGYVERVRPDLVIVDNISEVYDGNEIDRAMVRQFIQSMNKICAKLNCGLILVGHVDAATSTGKSSKGYSGSTAWHNSVRSRLFLRAGEVPGEVLLEPQKSNYGAVQPAMRLRWHPDDRVFVLVGTVEVVGQGRTVQKVMQALDKLERDGVPVPATGTGPKNGVGMLAKVAGLPTKVVREAINELAITKHIEEVAYQKTDRHTGQMWVLTAAGRASTVTEVDDPQEPAE